MIILENNDIKASFSSKGAELRSLVNKLTTKEYMWSGDPAYWGKFSPVLFPIVGGLKENSYTFNGEKYELPRHGFARDNEFDVEQISASEVRFSLKQSPKTAPVYPFEFELHISYQLIGDLLRCTYQVNNTADTALLFSIGAHPAFAIHTGDDLAYTDYYLEFNKDENLVYHKIKKDLIDDETVTINLDQHTLPLKHELFYDDALVFKTLNSDSITIRNKKNEHGLDFHFMDFPFFGIWSAKDADFICLEPWCGIADGIHHNQNLREKEGIISLDGKNSWTRNWEVRTF